MQNRLYLSHFAHLAILGTFALAAGCAGRPTTPTDEEPAIEQEAKPTEAAEPMREHGKGGPERLLRAALEELQLSAEQRTAIQSSLEDLHDGDHAPMKSVFSTLAAGVRAGKLDDAAIQTQLDAVGRAATDHRAKFVAAIQKLHDTLTAEQRSALVASLEKRAGERKGDHEGKHHGKDGARGPLARLLHGVDLTDEQRDRVQQAMAGIQAEGPKPAHAEMRAKGKAMLEAFAKDRFDAATLVPEQGHSPRAKLERVVQGVKAVVPILDESQRAKLADNLERKRGKHG